MAFGTKEEKNREIIISFFFLKWIEPTLLWRLGNHLWNSWTYIRREMRYSLKDRLADVFYRKRKEFNNNPSSLFYIKKKLKCDDWLDSISIESFLLYSSHSHIVLFIFQGLYNNIGSTHTVLYVLIELRLIFFPYLLLLRSPTWWLLLRRTS